MHRNWRTYASRMVEQLKHAEGVTGVSSDQDSGGPTLMLDIDRKAAAQYGLQTQAIDDALENAFGNRTATKVFGPFGQYFVIVGADPALSEGPDALDRLYLHAAGGNLVRLSQVAHITTQAGPVIINHQNQLPSVTISFNLKPGYSIGTAVTSVHKIADAMHLPLSLQASFAGTANAYQTALAGQVPLIGAALVAIYLILGVLYESVSHPVTIISTLPAAGLGALLTLKAVGMPLDVIGIIGILLLLGIVKKNGIMLVDFAIGAEREGKSPTEAIHEACRLRFRPILMTTICAMLGGVPLILGARHRIADPCAARLHHRRRPRRVTGAHAVHDTDHLHSSIGSRSSWRIGRHRASAGGHAWSGDMIRIAPVMRHRPLLPAISVIAVTLTGCAVGPDYHQPQTSVPVKWDNAAAGVPANWPAPDPVGRRSAPPSLMS